MLPQEIIRKKRDGAELSAQEIAFITRGITDGSLSEGQVAAFAMAVFFRNMTSAELTAMTLGLATSGVTLDWNETDLPGPILDKHSTGGVGDKVSLMLAPIVAACGGFVPMISGRGLGHTGGTLDKLSAISGYDVQPDIATFRKVVREVGCAIIGQTNDLAPADRRLYGVRDVTATVESIPLIVSSILSKKIAAGLDGLVMDVKCGSGAFCDTQPMADTLAAGLVYTANQAGLSTAALITDMDRVLGREVGNALEVMETVAYLKGEGVRDPRLHEVVMALAGEMLALGDLAPSAAAGRARAEAALEDGRAAEKFAQMVSALGGANDFMDQPARYLERAPAIRPCTAEHPGFVVGMNARDVGIAVVALGGGRAHADDAINPSVGLSEMIEIGTAVRPGSPLCVVHAASEADADEAIARVRRAIRIGNLPPPAKPAVIDRVVIEELAG
ncbi:MAG: thymidine phosphorylase [Reyranella sp.]|uniref:thymidine phosphorylase n=1 Tax=Reyranella sp. TaxID=1929291 RepID=UPI001ACD15E6|nr:thymidine phosphorylase [Reyranella sp.]MBN9089406.1 thymidine phosphorylase [Reyranella sp.]